MGLLLFKLSRAERFSTPTIIVSAWDAMSSPVDLRFEDLTLSSSRHELMRGNRFAALTRTEFALLEALMRRAGVDCPQGRTGLRRLGLRLRCERKHALRFCAIPARQDHPRRRASTPSNRQRSRIQSPSSKVLKKQLSISLRLTCWFSAIFLAGFIVFGVVMWADLAGSMYKGREKTLEGRASRFTELLLSTRHENPVGSRRQIR